MSLNTSPTIRHEQFVPISRCRKLSIHRNIVFFGNMPSKYSDFEHILDAEKSTPNSFNGLMYVCLKLRLSINLFQSSGRFSNTHWSSKRCRRLDNDRSIRRSSADAKRSGLGASVRAVIAFCLGTTSIIPAGSLSWSEEMTASFTESTARATHTVCSYCSVSS